MSHSFTEILSGLGNFAIYFSLSIIFILVFKFVFTRITPHDEWRLVKEEKNMAAAIALSGSLIGFSIALAGAAQNSVSLFDFFIWGVIAFIAQILAYFIIKIGFLPKVSQRIEANEIPAGIMVAATSISVGLLNAACLSY